MAVAIILASVSAWFMLKAGDITVFNQQDKIRQIHMVTGEFKSTMKDGKEIEAYRWDPGTIILKKGEKVNLIISGINGVEHPFYIEGTSIKGTVKKGEDTFVPLQFQKEGTYRLICEMHTDRAHNGPMIAYIVVN